jgi:PPM family protein phosphatase
MARENNEDDFFISETEALCIVADGMGGHRSGEVASRMAIETIRAYYDESLVDEDFDKFKFRVNVWPFKRRRPQHAEERRLVQGVMLANAAIYDKASSNEECRGMGTTIVGAFFLESGAYVIHIGDSRCYRLREGKLERLTMDHSLANEYLQMGILRPDEVEHFPYKNVITRAVGLADTVEPDVHFETIQPDDVFLFCSDGLTDPVNDRNIQRVLEENRSDLHGACLALIEAANAGGGPDNVTAVLAYAFRD